MSSISDVIRNSRDPEVRRAFGYEKPRSKGDAAQTLMLITGAAVLGLFYVNATSPTPKPSGILPGSRWELQFQADGDVSPTTLDQIKAGYNANVQGSTLDNIVWTPGSSYLEFYIAYSQTTNIPPVGTVFTLGGVKLTLVNIRQVR